MTFLFLGYSVFWLLLAAYVAMLGARQRRLAEEVADLSAALDKGAGRRMG
ncbi:MAG: CcmD family protein [Limnochordales bacterium]|nr:CcmD family protein [Limnochordales bacterium]